MGITGGGGLTQVCLMFIRRVCVCVCVCVFNFCVMHKLHGCCRVCVFGGGLVREPKRKTDNE